MSEYGKVKQGGLVLKGGLSLSGKKNNNNSNRKKKKKKSKKRKKIDSGNDEKLNNKQSEDDVELEKKIGSGKIIVSGTTVTGINTKFKHEIKVGDIIGITHQSSKGDEVKIVRFILSDTNLSISSDFSNTFVECIPYFYINKRKIKQTKEEEAIERESKRLKTIESATGKHISASYKNLSREELLDLRVHKSGDRRC
jgi:hypothetical protein